MLPWLQTLYKQGLFIIMQEKTAHGVKLSLYV